MSNLVPVTGGFEAATWRDKDCAKLDIWRWEVTDRRWRRIARIGDAATPQVGECEPRLTGERLAGASDATFISFGCYTGDGAVNAAAFSDGPRGWGVVQGAGLRFIASRGDSRRARRRAGYSVRWGMRFVDGDLETINGNNGFFGDAGADSYPLTALWRWNGIGYEGVTNNEFVAHEVTPPPVHAPALKARKCPSGGRFQATIAADVHYFRRGAHPDLPLHLYAFAARAPVTSRGRSLAVCEWRIWPNFPLSVLVAHTTSREEDKRRWITAPAWLMASGTFNDFGRGHLSIFESDGDVTPGEAPWAVPRRWHINLVLSDTGHAFEGRRRLEAGYLPRHPTHATLTIRNGVITGLAIDPRHRRRR